jgi:1,4-dihydroxy-2-naphthoate polyprenyltransferase
VAGRWPPNTPTTAAGPAGGATPAATESVTDDANRWVLGARPRTLPAAVVPVAVGTAVAVGEDGGIIWWRAAAALVVSLALQVGTNYVNDYADGVRGTDTDRVGPVRLVGSGLATVREVKLAALAAFAVAALAGLVLSLAIGPELLVVGAVSILAGWAYTGGPKPYAYRGLGEVFVFVFFGLVATAGSAYVQLERLTLLAVEAAVPVGLAAVALLVVNNLRDIPTDAASAKLTLAVRLGDGGTRLLYQAVVAGIVLGILALGLTRPWALLGLVGALAWWPPVAAIRAGARGPALIGVLGATGRAQLLTGLTLALGLALGG